MPLFAVWLLNVIARLFPATFAVFGNIKFWLVTAFFAIIAAGTVSLVFRVFIALGIGYITYNLTSFALDILFTRLTDSFDTLPVEVLTFLSMARIDDFISVMFSALSARLVLAGFKAASLRVATFFNPLGMGS